MTENLGGGKWAKSTTRHKCWGCGHQLGFAHAQGCPRKHPHKTGDAVRLVDVLTKDGGGSGLRPSS